LNKTFNNRNNSIQLQNPNNSHHVSFEDANTVSKSTFGNDSEKNQTIIKLHAPKPKL